MIFFLSQEMRRSLPIFTKNIFGLLAVIYFGGTLSNCNEDIPWCDKRLIELKEDVQD